jgi:hypothetical protein
MHQPLVGLMLVGTLGCGSSPAPKTTPGSLPVTDVQVPLAPEGEPCTPSAAYALPSVEAKSPLGRPLDNGELAARTVLVDVVRNHGLVADNPWAVSHALLALGPDVTLGNGQPAVDHLFAEFAELQSVGEHQGVAFPARRGGIRVEPHADLLLKAFTERGLTPDHAVRVGDVDTNLGALYGRSQCAAWTNSDQTGFTSWNDTPWALQGLAAWARPDDTWIADAGHVMTMDRFTHDVVARLVAETSFLREAMAKGATVQKRKQGIFSYTCGGAHLLQGTTYAVARGFGEPTDKAAVVQELEVYTWRLDLELTAVDSLVTKHPEYTDLLLVQRMKFLGHYLETLHKAAALGLYADTSAHRTAIERGADELVATVNSLLEAGTFERMAHLKTSNEQLYLDLIGDSAHAVRGFGMHSGEGVIRY